MSKTDPTKISLQTNVQRAKDPTLVRMSGRTYHRNMEFDVPFMNEIIPGLWQGGCQNGLQLPHFIKHVVSLYPWEQYQVKHEIDSYLTVRVYDSEAQDTSQLDSVAQWVADLLKDGKPILVHCQAGLNRSSYVVAKALLLAGKVETGQEAINLLRENRSPACLCNPTFEEAILAND